MRPHSRCASGAAALLRRALGLLLCLAALSAAAQDDPPGRVGRIAELNGSVAWWDHEAGQWADAERNRPLTGGDRISTAASGRAELRIGSTVLRLSNNTEAELLRLDDERIAVQLHSGALALRVRSREVADEIELVTEEAVLRPASAGHYRLDRIDDATRAAVWRGQLRVDDAAGIVVGNGQAVELFRTGRRDAPGELRSASLALPADGFTEWVMDEDRRDERSASTRYVSPEMTGAEELDRAGRWDQHPEYGAIWLPLAVQSGWAPYRYGRWAWVSPWGWTWIDDAPWGFAPFHYGRWVSWNGRWGWVPGAYVARPIYAPALVAWLGGPSFGVSVQIGGGPVGWVPLAPREVYRPYYRHTPRYVERINPVPPYRWQHPPGHPPREPVSYGNQGVPNGVTVVPRDVLQRRQPVGRAVIEPPRDGRGGPGPRQWVGGEPPTAPTHGLVGGRRPEPGRPLLRQPDPRRDDGAGRQGPPREARPPQAQPAPQQPPQQQQPPPPQQPVAPQPGIGGRGPYRGEGVERDTAPWQRPPERPAPGLAVPDRGGAPGDRSGSRADDARGGDRQDRPFDRGADRADREPRRDGGGRPEGGRDGNRDGNRDGSRPAPSLRAPAPVPPQPMPQAQQPRPAPAAPPVQAPPDVQPARPVPVAPQVQAPQPPPAAAPRVRDRGGDDDRKRVPEGPGRDRRERDAVR